MPDRTPRLLLAALLPALLAVALTACGGGGDGGDGVATLSGETAGSTSEGGSGDDGADVDPEDAFVEFARCMREHGVDMPDPQPGGEGVVRVGPGEAVDPGSEEFREADEACRPILEEAMGELPEPSPEEQAEMRDRMLAFSRCMREHGVDMPDPTFGEDGSAMVELAPADEAGRPDEDPDFAEAQEACGDLLGEPGEGGITFEVGS